MQGFIEATGKVIERVAKCLIFRLVPTRAESQDKAAAADFIECIGHLNLGMALHPVILKDGRIIFSSLESQGLRSHHLWGVWSIHPDGTRWGPIVSAFEIRVIPSG